MDYLDRARMFGLLATPITDALAIFLHFAMFEAGSVGPLRGLASNDVRPG
jgi:hypothetical protein